MGGLGSFFGGGDSPEKTNVLASLLQSNDIGSLQSSYNDLITKAISGPSRSEPDNQALMFQVAIPTILAGLLGGKRGLAASAEPVGQAYMRELERSKEAQKQSQARDLTAAELVGKRINDVQDTFEKAAALEEKRALAQDQIQSREDIAKMNNDTKQMYLGMQAQNMAESRRNAERDDAERARERRGDESRSVTKMWETKVKPIGEKLAMAENVLNLLARDTSLTAGAVTTQLARLAGETGVLSNQDIARLGVGKTGKGAFVKLKNWALGDTASPLIPEEVAAVKEMVLKKSDELRKQYSLQEENFIKGLETNAPHHAADPNLLNQLVETLKSSGYHPISPVTVTEDARLQRFRQLKGGL